VTIHGIIFDLGSTLIHRTGLELEREQCRVLADFAAAEWGCTNPEGLATHLLAVRVECWRRSDEDLHEHLATEPIADAFAAAGLPTDEATLRRAEDVFFEPEVRNSRLYPGAVETLEAVRGMGLQLGMISNATSHRLIQEITGKHGIGGYFDPLVTSAQFGRIKPHPGIFTHVLEAWRLPPRSVVMIGDTLRADILGAHTVGMRSILVDIEPNPANARFAGTTTPTARVTSLEEIPSIVRTWGDR